jgi:hypothetical protein
MYLSNGFISFHPKKKTPTQNKNKKIPANGDMVVVEECAPEELELEEDPVGVE